jgi:hypothetical protein
VAIRALEIAPSSSQTIIDPPLVLRKNTIGPRYRGFDLQSSESSIFELCIKTRDPGVKSKSTITRASVSSNCLRAATLDFMISNRNLDKSCSRLSNCLAQTAINCAVLIPASSGGRLLLKYQMEV